MARRGFAGGVSAILVIDARCARLPGIAFAANAPGHTLNPQSSWDGLSSDWRDRGHFFALSARIMRRYLIDHRASNFSRWKDSL